MNSPTLLRAGLRSVRRATWAVVAILLLGFLLLVDRFYPSYVEEIEKRDDAELRLARAQASSDLLPKFQTKLTENFPLYEEVRASSFLSPDATQSVENFQSTVHAVLSDAQIKDATVSVAEPLPTAAVQLLTSTVEFSCIPRQLAELERRLLASPKRIQVAAMNVEVAPDPIFGGQQLRVSLTLRAVHISHFPEAPK